MSELKRELACASCDKTGSLYEDVTVEATGTRRATPYAVAGGKVKVEHGRVEDADHRATGRDVISVDEIYCSACGESFASWEDATAETVYEHRCGECGWWGVQEWLHDPACSGELERLRLPRHDPAQIAVAA